MICPQCGMHLPLDRGESYFDGGLLQLIGWRILGALITASTAGICYPWAVCMIYNWEVKHTVINGRRLKFDGTAAQLFGNWIKWWFLSLITLGIYTFWLPIKIKQWVTSHTSVVDVNVMPKNIEPPEYKRQSVEKRAAPAHPDGTIHLSRLSASDPSIPDLEDFVVLDTETTGLSPQQDKIVEIALLRVSGGKIVDEYCTLVNPQKHINSSASRVNHIYDVDVKDAPLYDEVGEKVTAFLGNCTIVGHNVKFDLGFIGGLLKNVVLAEGLNWSYIDTIDLAKTAYPGMENYKLQTLVDQLSIKTKGAHRARADALATWKLFEHCQKKL